MIPRHQDRDAVQRCQSLHLTERDGSISQVEVGHDQVVLVLLPAQVCSELTPRIEDARLVTLVSEKRPKRSSC